MNFHPPDIASFLAVVQHGNLSRAAAQLGVSQPSISRALRRLEDEIGVLLFERGAHGARLTAEGRLFVDAAKRYELQRQEMARTAQELRAHHAGLLRIGLTNASADGIAVRALAGLVKQRPGLRVTLSIGKSDALNDAVEAGELDLAVVPSYPGYAFTCTQVALAADRMQVIARAGHPLASRAGLSLADLAGQGWIMPDRRSVARRLVTGILERASAPAPRVVVEVDYVSEAVLGLVVATDLLALVPVATLGGWLGRVAPLELPALSIERTSLLLARPDAHWSPLMSAFRDALLATPA